MRRNSDREGMQQGHELRPRPVRLGWGRMESGGHERVAELVRLNAERSARRRLHDRRFQVVRDLLAGRRA